MSKANYPFSGYRSNVVDCTREALSGVRSKVLIDMGCGRGGALGRWAEMSFDVIVAVDRHRDRLVDYFARSRTFGISDKVRMVCGDWDDENVVCEVKRLVGDMSCVIVATHCVINNNECENLWGYLDLKVERMLVTYNHVGKALKDALGSGLRVRGERFQMRFPENRPGGFQGKVDLQWDWKFDVMKLPTDRAWVKYDYVPNGALRLNKSSRLMTETLKVVIFGTQPRCLNLTKVCENKPRAKSGDEIIADGLAGEEWGKQAFAVVRNGPEPKVFASVTEYAEEDDEIVDGMTFVDEESSCMMDAEGAEYFVPLANDDSLGNPVQMVVPEQIQAVPFSVIPTLVLLGADGPQSMTGTTIAFDLSSVPFLLDHAHAHCPVFYNKDGFSPADLYAAQMALTELLAGKTYPAASFTVEAWGKDTMKVMGPLWTVWKNLRARKPLAIADYNNRSCHVSLRDLTVSTRCSVTLYEGYGLITDVVMESPHLGKLAEAGRIRLEMGAMPRGNGAPYKSGPPIATGVADRLRAVATAMGRLHTYFNRVVMLDPNGSFVTDFMLSELVVFVCLNGEGVVSIRDDVADVVVESESVKAGNAYMITNVGVEARPGPRRICLPENMQGFVACRVRPEYIADVPIITPHDHGGGETLEKIYHVHRCSYCMTPYGHTHNFKGLNTEENRKMFTNTCGDDNCLAKERHDMTIQRIADETIGKLGIKFDVNPFTRK